MPNVAEWYANDWSHTQYPIFHAQYRLCGSHDGSACYPVIQIVGEPGNIKGGVQFKGRPRSFSNHTTLFDFLNPILPSLCRGVALFSPCFVRRDGWLSVLVIFGYPTSQFAFGVRINQTVYAWLSRASDAAQVAKQIADSGVKAKEVSDGESSLC
jgi:hypothetical protein